jgi:hypothetical protein
MYRLLFRMSACVTLDRRIGLLFGLLLRISLRRLLRPLHAVSGLDGDGTWDEAEVCYAVQGCSKWGSHC